MNYFYYSDLLNYLSRDGFSYTSNLARNIAYNRLTILNVLKKQSVCHNNIKLENFIVESINPFKIILTDFEAAKNLIPNEKIISNYFTPSYAAPEVLCLQPHDYSADIWSLGIALYLSMFGIDPFQISPDDSVDEVKQKISKNPLSPINQVLPDAWECIEQLLVLDPNSRLTAENALKMEWFKFMECDEAKTSIQSFAANINFDNESTEG